MKCLVLLAIALLVILGVVPRTSAEPAWGANCLSCHGDWYTGLVNVYGADTTADPDESATGAPDRGPLPVFQVVAGQARTHTVELLGMDPGDTYATELWRLRFPGVETGGELAYSEDCDWAYWGEPGKYYTDPAVKYEWGAGPAAFAFDLEVGAGAPYDYYDVVFAVAGRLAYDGSLYYAEEHFYVQVIPLVGDLDGDGNVDLDDFNVFAACFTGPDGRLAPGCEWCDFDDDGDIDCFDWQEFRRVWPGPEDPPEFPPCNSAVPAIPTVSGWGIMALSLLLVVAGTLVLTRREVQDR